MALQNAIPATIYVLGDGISTSFVITLNNSPMVLGDSGTLVNYSAGRVTRIFSPDSRWTATVMGNNVTITVDSDFVAAQGVQVFGLPFYFLTK